jgi:hypothetical protein
MTAKQIVAALSSGRWQRLHTGVYATFSGEPGRRCALWAAVLRPARARSLVTRPRPSYMGWVER